MNLKVFHLKVVNSTNNFAIRKIKQGKIMGIVISDSQKKGRGRHGNKWISQSGNLFISIFYRLNKKISLKEIITHNEQNYVIIGIGINIHKNPNIKNYPTTSLLKYNNKINKMIIFKNIKKNYEKEILCI